jgi:hypothetical protein
MSDRVATITKVLSTFDEESHFSQTFLSLASRFTPTLISAVEASPNALCATFADSEYQLSLGVDGVLRQSLAGFFRIAI